MLAFAVLSQQKSLAKRMKHLLPTLILLGSSAAACGGVRPVVAPPIPVQAVQPPPPVVQAEPPKPADPIDILIADSEKQFVEGQKHLESGHLEQARQAFDRSIEMLLE